MKILITSYWYAPAINGVVTSVCNLEKELIKNGHDVRILTISQDKHSHKEDNVYYIGSMSLGMLYPYARFPIKSQNKFYDEIIDWEPDVIHSQCEFFTFSVSVKIAKTLDIPLIHTYHTIYEDYTHYFSPSATAGGNAVALFSRKVLAKADKIIAPTQKTKGILESYKVRPDIFTVPTGIDMEKFSPSSDTENIQTLRKNLGLKKNQKLLISVGRIAREKNLDEIIDGIKILDDKNIKLLIVGDGPYRRQLVEKVHLENLKDRVIFTGMVSPDEVSKYYELGDVFVSASSSETQGLTYIEALACGLPVVCREDECVKGVVIEGENGYTFSDMDGFAESIGSVLSNGWNYRRMSRRAKESSMKFSMTAFADSMTDIYADSIEEKVTEIEEKYGKGILCRTMN